MVFSAIQGQKHIQVSNWVEEAFQAIRVPLLWSASRTKGGGRDVAKGAARTRTPGARDLRVSLLIPAISLVIVGGDLFPC